VKAVKRFQWKIACAALTAAGFVLLWQCANPSNKPPLRWQTTYDVPLTNDSFFLAQQMTNLFSQINGQKIDVLGSGRSPKDTGIYYDTANPRVLLPDTGQFRALGYGDTAVFSILQDDTISYDVHQDSMKSQDFHPRIGPILLSNVPTYSATIAPAAGSFNQAVTLPLHGITTVTFDPTSPAMTVTVTNNSSATITGLTIGMFGGTQQVASLAPNSSAPVTVPVAGQSIAGGMLPITVLGSASAPASLTISFNANGLLASYAQVMDSLVPFSTQVINDYNLTDTLNVDYIDILTGAFVYAFHNYTQIPMQINIIQLNLWQSSYCVQDSLISLATLTTANAGGLDSSFYFGQLTSQPQVIASGGAVADSLRSNLSGLRLFPVWNPNIGTSGESVSRVVYTVTNVPPTGKTVTINAGDSMLFTIRAPHFKFQEMTGTVVLPYVRTGDTAKVAVPFPWNSASKDSLRGNLILNKVWADLFLQPNLPDSTILTPRRAMIDTIGIVYSIFNPLNPSVHVDSSSTLHNVVNDTVYRLKPTDIGSIINQYPDSMYITVGVTVPAGTYLRAINELTQPTQPNYNLYMGQMFLKADITARMNAVLTWQVNNSTSLDLGTGRFKVPKATRYITKMDGLQATVHMTTLNRSNVYLNLYALMAPKAHMNALDSLPLDSVWAYIGNSAMAQSAGYINLLGTSGVPIPQRDSTVTDSVALSEWQIDSLLQGDSAGWRWEARFMPMGSDALSDTDFIKIKSYMHLVGNNNMDSLLIWH
jgi:hypothetical protein